MGDFEPVKCLCWYFHAREVRNQLDKLLPVLFVIDRKFHRSICNSWSASVILFFLFLTMRAITVGVLLYSAILASSFDLQISHVLPLASCHFLVTLGSIGVLA